MRVDEPMSCSLREEVSKFKAWTADLSAEKRSGEWECNYPFWGELCQCFRRVLDLSLADVPNAALIRDLLYAIGRDNEDEELIEELASRGEWFMFALPHALASDDADVRWQFAKQLGTGRFNFAQAEQALMALVMDGHEYVSRVALQALGRLGSSHAEEMCERAWSTGHEYQRIMALCVLKEIRSPKLSDYVARAQEDGRAYVVYNAGQITQGTSER